MKFEIFKDKFNFWYWRFVNFDNEIIAYSSKGSRILKIAKAPLN